MDDVGILFQNNKKHQTKQNTTKFQVTVPKQAKPPMNTRTTKTLSVLLTSFLNSENNKSIIESYLFIWMAWCIYMMVQPLRLKVGGLAHTSTQLHLIHSRYC